MHSMACIAWQFRQALLSGKDAKVHTTRGKAAKNKNRLPTLTKNKIWEWYGKAWAICGPYVGIVWEG